MANLVFESEEEVYCSDCGAEGYEAFDCGCEECPKCSEFTHDLDERYSIKGSPIMCEGCYEEYIATNWHWECDGCGVIAVDELIDASDGYCYCKDCLKEVEVIDGHGDSILDKFQKV